MKKIVVAAVIAIWCAPSATLAGERVGDAALGALSGAVVLGPVGAVAGAVIGYTAGPPRVRALFNFFIEELNIVRPILAGESSGP